MKHWLIFWIAALGMAAPASAEWHEASSDNFVIYADDSEENVRRFAEMLEQYHAAMELVTSRTVEKPSPSSRVTIFASGNQRDIRKLAGGDNRAVAGFYIPRAGGSRAFVQDIRLTNGYPDFSTVILLHEYAHHFLISTSRHAMPRWLSEGAAEFFAAASFNSDGSVKIGLPAQHRARELAFADDVSVQELLDYDLYEANKGKRTDAFYGRSWLLYHYLSFSEQRRGQLTDYWLKVSAGEPSIDAARAVFGDLDALEKELGSYLKQRKMPVFSVPAEMLEYGNVQVRALSEGEAKIMPLRIRSQRGVNAEQAAEILPEVRKIAAKYPQDAAVLTALAEAEHDAGDDAKAIAAADAALAIDLRKTNAYVQKGMSMFRMAEKSDDKPAAYRAAMTPFSALNRIENDHPLPLIYYYRSFGLRGDQPTQQARSALERAAELAPFDQTLWINVGVMQASNGRIAQARDSLGPLAADPHGGWAARTAKRLLTQLDSAEEGKPFTRSRPVVGLRADRSGDEIEEGDEEEADDGADIGEDIGEDTGEDDGEDDGPAGDPADPKAGDTP